MNWSFSLKLMPGEEIVEQQQDTARFGIQAMHTPILTNRRAMFRFNSLSSGLIQSFTYDEISDARPANRLMIKYLRLTASGKEYYLNVDVPEEWALKILGFKEQQADSAGGRLPETDTGAARIARSPAELSAMLGQLRDAGVLTEGEHAEMLGRIKP